MLPVEERSSDVHRRSALEPQAGISPWRVLTISIRLVTSTHIKRVIFIL